MPERQSARIRRGTEIYIAERLPAPLARAFSYADVCEDEEAFSSAPTPPANLKRLPFRISGDLDDEEIIGIVEFIRLGPSIPKRLISGDGGGRRRFFITGNVRNPAGAVYSLTRNNEVIEVEMAAQESRAFETCRCRQIDDEWTLIGTS